MSSDDESIRFGCPRCTSEIAAPLAAAGTAQRCPMCFTPLVVPRASRAAPNGYQIGSDTAAKLPARPSVSWACTTCHTLLSAELDQIGESIACPDCGMKSKVPSPIAPHGVAPPAPVVESYAVRADNTAPPVGQAPRSPAGKSSEDELRVYCRVCNTLMYASLDQVGRQLTCPDCTSKTLVRPPDPKSGLKPASHRTDDAYDVAGAPAPPVAITRDPQIVFRCFSCGTHMMIAERSAGVSVACPSCGIVNIVPARPAPSKAVVVPPPASPIRPGAGASTPNAGPRSDGGTVRPNAALPGRSAVAPRPRDDPPPAPLPVVEATEELSDGKPEFPPLGADAPPLARVRHPMLSGIFTFPFQLVNAATWCWLALGFASLFFGAVGVGVLSGQVTPGGGVGQAGFGILAVFGCGALAIFATLVAMYLGLCGLAIIGDTSSGNDIVETWPGLFQIFDEGGQSLFFFAALLHSLAPGAGAAWLVARYDGSALWAIPVSLFVFLPLVQLSMLEQNSRLVPVSMAVAASMFHHPLAWFMFYVEAAVLVLSVAGLTLAAVNYLSWSIAASVLALVFSAALMIYCRLLGRLGWCASR